MTIATLVKDTKHVYFPLWNQYPVLRKQQRGCSFLAKSRKGIETIESISSPIGVERLQTYSKINKAEEHTHKG